MSWAIGLDVHNDTIAAAALNSTGELTASATFENTEHGHLVLYDWIVANSSDVRWGLQPSGGVGHAGAALL
jgi:hypothetical protein